MTTGLLLVLSNIFMTFAWYGHLKFKGKPVWIVIVLSWGLAFFEYLFQVPANRIGTLLADAAENHAGVHHDRRLHDHHGAALPTDAALEQYCPIPAHPGGGYFTFNFDN
jgi:hypothetical protein